MIRPVPMLVLLAFLLAGCAGGPMGTDPKPSSSPPPTPTSSMTATQTSTQEPGGNLTTPRLQLSQCVGFGGSTMPSSRALGPGTSPPGWEPMDPLVLTSSINVGGWECNRVNLGPYERGPVRFIWDGHNNADVPAECEAEQPPTTFSEILNVMFVNDAEIAAYLNATYGMPAQYSEIQTEAQASGPLTLRTWTWGPQQTQSELTFVDDEADDVRDAGNRFFWQRGEGIGALDLLYAQTGPAFTNRNGYGTMQAPMLVSEGNGQFVGPVDYFSPMDGEGTFALYTDLECKQAAPFT